VTIVEERTPLPDELVELLASYSLLHKLFNVFDAANHMTTPPIDRQPIFVLVRVVFEPYQLVALAVAPPGAPKGMP